MAKTKKNKHLTQSYIDSYVWGKYVSYVFKKSVKVFSIGLSSAGGRNFKGRVCITSRGGGSLKKKHIIIDRFRRLNSMGHLLKIFKTPFINAFLGYVLYDIGLCSFIILASDVEIGAWIYSGTKSPFMDKYSKHPGSTILLKNLSLFSIVHSIETKPCSGFKYVRSAGTSAFIINTEPDFKKVWLKLNSGWNLLISEYCLVCIGSVSNSSFKSLRIKKAGSLRILGRRPRVRGIVKNPCDHPHGGGEGKGSPPVAQVSAWGRLTKGTPTKNKIIDRLNRRYFKSTSNI